MNNREHKFWWRFELEIPYELEESLIWKLGSISINSFAIESSPERTDLVKLCLWLPANEWSSEDDRNNLFDSFNSLAKTFEKDLNLPIWIKVEDEDWNLTWKKHWKPSPVGNSLLILPAWMDVPKTFSDRKIIRLDPGCAFGTGSHPSTLLCLEELDSYKYHPNGLKVADIGCGSGILSLTSLALGAKKVFAVDTDLLAINSTFNNFHLNAFKEDDFCAFQGSIDLLHSKLKKDHVDLILCNILAPVIKTLAPSFNDLVGSFGRALLSGILVDQVSELSSLFIDLGWRIDLIRHHENWSLIGISKH